MTGGGTGPSGGHRGTGGLVLADTQLSKGTAYMKPWVEFILLGNMVFGEGGRWGRMGLWLSQEHRDGVHGMDGLTLKAFSTPKWIVLGCWLWTIGTWNTANAGKGFLWISPIWLKIYPPKGTQLIRALPHEGHHWKGLSLITGEETGHQPHIQTLSQTVTPPSVFLRTQSSFLKSFTPHTGPHPFPFPYKDGG